MPLTALAVPVCCCRWDAAYRDFAKTCADEEDFARLLQSYPKAFAGADTVGKGDLPDSSAARGVLSELLSERRDRIKSGALEDVDGVRGSLCAAFVE